MCLSNADLDRIKAIHKCYLTHPNRNDDTDDVLLDSANQRELSRKDLIEWVTSQRSWFLLEQEPDPEVSDFMDEFDLTKSNELWKIKHEEKERMIGYSQN